MANTSKSHSTDNLVIKYCSEHSVRLHPIQEKLTKITKEHPRGGMLGSPDQLQLLCNMLKMIKAKKTLDIGVFTGMSALSVALVLPPDGKVVALDINEDYVNIGKPVWKEAGLDSKIDLRIAPALETLDKLIENGESGTFDFAFIDAHKPEYWDYFERCLKLLRPGGFMAFDNILWRERVVKAWQDPSLDLGSDTAALVDFNKKLANDPRVDISMLRLGDGTTLAFKKWTDE